MRVEYIIVGFVIMMVVLLVALSMLGGVSNSLEFLGNLFKKSVA